LAPELDDVALTAPSPKVSEVTAADFGGEGLIRDERGVRLAPEIED
jgi:hypothetical protein